MENLKVILNPHVVRRKFKKEMLLIHTRSGLVLTLNKTGSDIMGLVDDIKTVAEISRHIAKKYGENYSHVARDVKKFLSEMAKRDIVELK